MHNGKRISKNVIPDIDGCDEENNESDHDENVFEDDVEEDNDEGGIEDGTTVSTPLGDLNPRTAEAIYLNGGKTVVGSQKRKKRFHKSVFNTDSGFSGYHRNRNPCCSKAVKVGQTIYQKGVGRGIVKFISQNHNPLHFVCRTHSTGTTNIWFLIPGIQKYCRSAF